MRPEQGKTHGWAFGHDSIGKRYKGRYNPELQTATIALPYFNGQIRSENWLIKNDPDIIPVINAIHREWPDVKHIFSF